MRTKAPTRSNHMDDQPLKGQKALVTGASSGIGEGVARALGAAGAAVVVNYVAKPEAAAKIVEEIRGNGVDAVAIRGDVSKELEVEAMFAEDRKSTRLNSSHGYISYAVFCLKKKKKIEN